MKTKFKIQFVAVAVVMFLSMNANAQMFITPGGKTLIGPERTDDDFDGILSMQITGRNGQYNAESKLAFGDFGSLQHYGWNVFVGEYGDYDSDILWLHGKNGIRLTSWDGSYILAEFGCGPESRVTLSEGVRLQRLTNSSDDNHKDNVKVIDKALDHIMDLTSITYDYYNPQYDELRDRPTQLPSSRDCKNPADSANMATFQSALVESSHHYGFMTRDVELLFPDLVETDASGNQYVNYIELIPVIVSSIQEIATTLNIRGNTSGQNPTSDQSFPDPQVSPSNHSDSRFADSATLYQNNPNPFDQTTEISYFVPTSATSATIYIFNLTGALQRTIPVTAFGHSSVTVDGSTLQPGMYVYTLVVDGQIIDSKRMILTQ